MHQFRMAASDQSTSVVDVDIVRSARRRRLAIHVSPHGKVEVRAPFRTSAFEISAFLDQHRDWVLKKIAEAGANPPWQAEWRAGGQWYWQGERLTLAPGGPRGARLFDGQLALPVAHDEDSSRWQRSTLLWHRRAAETLLAARSTALFDTHCAEHRLLRVDLRWMRATWGTCSGKRAPDRKRDVVLRLNPLLACLPPALCDAILLHELAHVEHMNHSAAFYRRLAQMNPEWRAHDQELKQWGRLLFACIAT